MSDEPELPEVPDHRPRVHQFEEVIRGFAVDTVREALMIDATTDDGVPVVTRIP